MFATQKLLMQVWVCSGNSAVALSRFEADARVRIK